MTSALPVPEGPRMLTLISVAAAIGISAGLVGGLLSWKARRLLRHRPTVLSVFTAGVLIGLSLLSVLPDALDEVCSSRSSPQ